MTPESRQRGWPGKIPSLFGLILTIGFFAFFQAFPEDQKSGNVAPHNQMQRRNNRPTLDERVRQFAKNLDLSEAQQSAVKEILEQQQQEILRIRQDPSMIGRAGIDGVRALQEITVKRIRAILNEEQRKKYDPLAPRRLPPAQQPGVEDWLKVTAAKS